MSAAFEMPYTPMTDEPSRPPTDETMMIAPPPRSAICGSTMLHSQKLLRTFEFITLSYCFIGHVDRRSVVRIDRRIADERVDAAPLLNRRIHEPLQILLAADVARMRECFTALVLDRPDDFLARIELAARDDDLRAVLRETLGDRAPDAAARTGDDGDVALQIEQ